MKSRVTISRYLVLPMFLLILNNAANGQLKQNSDDAILYNEIAHMDSVLFGAFNSRDVDQFKNLLTTDLEFFHDKGGLTNYEHTIGFMKTTAQSDNKLRRDLVKGSLEVYPIPGYGAMEIGSHTFCHEEQGKQECGTFKFVHIWQKKDGQWKISRVVSYGH